MRAQKKKDAAQMKHSFPSQRAPSRIAICCRSVVGGDGIKTEGKAHWYRASGNHLSSGSGAM